MVFCFEISVTCQLQEYLVVSTLGIKVQHGKKRKLSVLRTMYELHILCRSLAEELPWCVSISSYGSRSFNPPLRKRMVCI